MPTKRSRHENSDLTYDVRIDGRIAASFRRLEWAEAFTYQMKEAFPDSMVELFWGGSIHLRLLAQLAPGTAAIKASEATYVSDAVQSFEKHESGNPERYTNASSSDSKGPKNS